MKRIKPKIIAVNKKDKAKAKLMEELMDYMFTEKDYERMRRNALLTALELETNPLGLIKVEWKKSKFKPKSG